MAKERIVITDTAKADFNHIIRYLEQEWSNEIAIRFIKQFYDKLDLIEFMPTIGKPSTQIEGVRRVLLDKRTAIYYEDIGTAILILRLIDTRSNPADNPY